MTKRQRRKHRDCQCQRIHLVYDLLIDIISTYLLLVHRLTISTGLIQILQILRIDINDFDSSAFSIQRGVREVINSQKLSWVVL